MARDNKNNDIIYLRFIVTNPTRSLLSTYYYQLIACYLVAPALNRNETVRVIYTKLYKIDYYKITARISVFLP